MIPRITGQDPDDRSANVIRIVGGRVWSESGFSSVELTITGEQIVAVNKIPCQRSDTVLDATGCFVVPGFIDLHVHGGDGVDFLEASEESISRIATFQASHGTTQTLASLAPADAGLLRRAIERLAEHPRPGVLGVHLEGPFVSPHQKGALNATHILPPNVETFSELVSGCEHAIRVVTLAPELPGSPELVAEVRRIGAMPAVGHSQATYRETVAAFRHGAGLITHLFNAMRGMHHREPGVVGAALLDPLVCLELIADGVHVHPSILRFVIETLKGQESLHRLCLISDSTSAAGCPDGTYELGGQPIAVIDGVARLESGELAGSTLTLDQALRNIIFYSNLPLEEAVRLVSANPATVLGREDLGTLRPGSQADVVVLDKDLGVQTTIRAGRIVYDKGNDRLER